MHRVSQAALSAWTEYDPGVEFDDPMGMSPHLRHAFLSGCAAGEADCTARFRERVEALRLTDEQCEVGGLEPGCIDQIVHNAALDEVLATLGEGE